MASQKEHETSKGNSDGKHNAVSDQEIRQESSKAANAAASAQKKAKELRDAAAGAGDPDEQQKLTEQAVEKEIEAESFGKTAKYLRSGAFQGMAIGAGLGTAPSATLGALTGTLVGSVTTVRYLGPGTKCGPSCKVDANKIPSEGQFTRTLPPLLIAQLTDNITGGLGGGIGAAAGALHGPIVNMGELAGKGVRKVTGNLPGWVASPEQKQALEKMVGEIKEQDMPDDDELKKLSQDGGDVAPDQGWLEGAKGILPSTSGSGKAQDNLNSAKGEGLASSGAEEDDSSSQKDLKRDLEGKGEQQSHDQEGNLTSREQELEDKLAEKESQLSKATDQLKTVQDELQDYKDRDCQVKGPEKASDGGCAEEDSLRKKPRKLETRSHKNDNDSSNTENTKAQPRKLDKRSL